MTQRPKADIVYAVEGYYDGPESGFANFRAEPHRFEAVQEWLVRERTVRLFRLQRVDEELLKLALEQQSLWSRWNASYRSGELKDELPYPERVLPEDLDHYRTLAVRIEKLLARPSDRLIFAQGRFFAGRRATPYRAPGENLRVVWSRCRAAA